MVYTSLKRKLKEKPNYDTALYRYELSHIRGRELGDSDWPTDNIHAAK